MILKDPERPPMKHRSVMPCQSFRHIIDGGDWISVYFQGVWLKFPTAPVRNIDNVKLVLEFDGETDAET